MSQEPDLTGWLTTKEALAKIGCSQRTLFRHVETGKIETRKKETVGKNSINVYSPTDVEKLAAERHAIRPAVLPPAQPEHPIIAGSLMVREPHQFWQQSYIPQTALPMEPAIKEPTLFLTIKEAAELTGLPQTFIRKAVEETAIPAIRTTRWMIPRAGLIRWVESL